MDKTNYREILAKIHKLGTLQKPTNNEERTLIEDAMCYTVLIAEENIETQENEWENSTLAREMLHLATLLPEDEEARILISKCAERMGDCISEHPRLSIAIMELLIRVGVDDKEEEKELKTRLATYKRNVELADRDELDKIPQTQMLKHDPVEWTERWEEVIDDVHREVAEHLKSMPRGMGFCHAMWSAKRKILRERYNIKWRSLSAMNPGVMFD